MHGEHCTLDASQHREQAARYRRLGAAAAAVERDRWRLAVTFEPTLDSDLLADTLAVERRCCAFLAIDFEPVERRLSIRAQTPGGAAALDAIAAALGTPESTDPCVKLSGGTTPAVAT